MRNSCLKSYIKEITSSRISDALKYKMSSITHDQLSNGIEEKGPMKFNNNCDEIENPILSLDSDERQGRFLKAERNISVGEVLFVEEPLVLSPKGGVGPTCLDCFLNLPEQEWQPCPTCRFPRCLACEGTYHTEEECEILSILKRKITNIDIKIVKLINTLLTPLRTLLKLNQSKDLIAILEALQSNVDRRKVLSIYTFIDNVVIPFMKNELKIKAERDWIHHICGVFDTNAFEMNLDNNRQSRALLPICGLMNHNCTPNTEHWFIGGKCVVRAATYIKKGDAITATYTQLLWGTKARKSHLLSTKLFICECRRCLDPNELGSFLSAIACKNCNLGFKHSKNESKDYICDECQHRTTQTEMKTYLQVASAVSAQASLMDEDALLRASLNIEKMLGRQHYLTIGLQYTYICKASKVSSQERLDEFISVCRSFQRVLRKVIPDFSKILAMTQLAKLKIIKDACHNLNTDCTNLKISKRSLIECADKLMDIFAYDVHYADVVEVWRWCHMEECTEE